MHIWADGLFNKAITKQTTYLPLAYPATAQSFMTKHGLIDIEAYKQRALLKSKKISGEFVYPELSLEKQSSNPRMNVLWIVIDAWRADTLTRQNMPHTYQFTRNAMQFNEHFSGSNNTRHGMFSLFYGLHGSYWDTMLHQQQPPFLYQVFEQFNYQTQVYASAKLTMPEFDQTLFATITNLRTHSAGKTPWQRDINAVDDFIADYQTNHPYFKLVFLDAAHGFSVPDNYPKVFEPALSEPNFMALSKDYDGTAFFNLYRNSLHFIDSQLRRVFQTIQGDLDNTIVVITGDHSEEFNDSKLGFWGHNSNYSRYQTHVPLAIHWPGKMAKFTHRVTSHVDLVPTFMEALFEVDTPTDQFSTGHSLFDSTIDRGSIVLGRKGYYAINDNQYIYELDKRGNFTIYDQAYQEKHSGDA